MDQQQQRDQVEEQYMHDYCGICEASPCRWDGLFPDGEHAPYPRDHDLDCGRQEQHVVVISPQSGAWVMTFSIDKAWGLDEVGGRICYVCRRKFRSDGDAVTTTLQVIGNADTLQDYRERGYYLRRHRDCAWPFWPECGCAYEPRDGGQP